MDKHHVAGKANSPVTIPVNVNDHRAELSTTQYDWPKETRENPEGSPLLAAAGCIRGFIDTIVHLVKKLLLPVASMLERLHEFLVRALGPRWWTKTELKDLTPKH